MAMLHFSHPFLRPRNIQKEMSGFVGILVSDPWLQNQFTQVELRSLKSHFMSMRRESGKLTVGELAAKMSRLKVVGENLTEEERASFIHDLNRNLDDDVDFESFLRESDPICKILDCIPGTGCFQLVNHGIPPETIGAALAAAIGVFCVSMEKKVVVTRSLEMPYGFEEGHGDEGESELSEQFVWCRDEGLKLKMEGIWPLGYSNFCEKMETLLWEIEKVSEKILLTLWESSLRRSICGNDMIHGQEVGSVCCLYKHSRNVPSDRWYDVIRMLIRGTDFSHALCLHVCDGASKFHVYSKKVWVSFTPDKGALIITVGDQIQASDFWPNRSSQEDFKGAS
ncbi:uncharacterized protein LOC132182696 isoform X2 [Corylus avellana]|uniref:uncharacterized protein LOC132182696 isoform X2 n=1 Tax=Corylus avellana TaxID=13451 RepID=UPI00286D0A1E|nr:uncharacterized protein LOC132182696 isoform X2 [Corylus avellana]